MKTSRLYLSLLSLPAVALFVLFFFLPVSSILVEAFSSQGVFARLLQNELFIRGLVGTLILGLVASVFSVIVGFAVALALNKLSDKTRTALLVMIALPLTFSGLIVAYGFILAFGRAGFITQLIAFFGADPAVVGGFIFTQIGLAFAYSYYLIPRVVMIMMPAVQHFDQVQLSVARSLGAGRFRTLMEVMVPQLAPSLIASFCLTAAVAMGAYGTALALVGTQMNILPLLLYSTISEGGTDMPMASAISIVLIAICCLVIALGELIQSKKN